MAWQDDSLLVVNPRRVCAACKGGRRARRNCDDCHGTGYVRADLAGLWAPCAGFLVCGGPSLNDYPLETLRERGVCALGVNNAAAYAPCAAMTFGDSQWKFHHSLFLDPKCLVFAPSAKLVRHVRWRDPQTGEFYFTDRRLADCPAVYGFARTGRLAPSGFLTDWFASWGHGGKEIAAPFRRLASMLLGLRLLHYLGVPRVYMLGVDFTWEDKSRGYAWGAPTSGGMQAYRKIDALLVEARSTFDEHGFAVWNCNAASRCEAFEHRPWAEAIADCRGAIEAEPFALDEWYGHRRMQRDKTAHPDLLPLGSAGAPR